LPPRPVQAAPYSAARYRHSQYRLCLGV